MTRTLTLALLLLAGGAATAQAQNLLIRGGPIYTGVEAHPTAEVVVVRDGRIAFVGAAAQAPAADGLEVVDLKGSALFPGFTDGHAHLDGIGWRELTLNLEGSASVAEAMARLSAWAETHPEGPIIGRGWIETRWPEARFLTAADLDAAAPGRVVLLERADGHAAVGSSAEVRKLAGSSARAPPWPRPGSTRTPPPRRAARFSRDPTAGRPACWSMRPWPCSRRCSRRRTPPRRARPIAPASGSRPPMAGPASTS